MKPLTFRTTAEQDRYDLAKACRLLRKLSGPNAERLALDMDHRNKDHAAWYRAVKRARKFLEVGA